MKTLLALVVVLSSLSGAYAERYQNQERALIAYMRVKPGTENEFLKAAQNVVKVSRQEVGNIRYQLHQSTTNPQQFVFYELFASHDDLEYHRNASHVKAFLQQTKSITVQFTLEEYIPEGELE